MELKKLDKSVLTLWYIRAALISLALAALIAGSIAIPRASGAPDNAALAISLVIGIPAALLLCVTLIMPALRYKMYAWGYDDRRIVVKQGVIFRKRVVIPVCQIQDLHRTQGPLMMMFKLSGVIISTAGSNFELTTLTTDEADLMIDDLERNLEARIEELKNEEI